MDRSKHGKNTSENMCGGEIIRGEDFTMSMKENLIGENFRPQVLRGVGVKVVLRGGLEGDGTLECREEGGGPEVTCDERKWQRSWKERGLW